MHIAFFSALFAALSVSLQVVFIGSPEYLLSLDPIRIGISAVISTLLFLVADIVNERFGLKATLFMISTGILAQSAAIIGAHFVGTHIEFSLAVFGIFGILSGEITDATIYALMRRLTGERFLLSRTFCSTTAALFIEGATLLYAAPALVLIAPQFTWKFLASLLNLPIVYFFRKRLFGK
jgi:uncharacterized PurR-regulated membrane protein YhhQ (DUF165 family)